MNTPQLSFIARAGTDCIVLAIDFFNLPYCVAMPPEHGSSIEAPEPHDALHIAIAAVNGIQCLATLNFTLIAAASMRIRAERDNETAERGDSGNDVNTRRSLIAVVRST